MDQLKDEVLSFLQHNKPTIVERWKEKAMDHSSEPSEWHQKKLIMKGQCFFSVVIHALALSPNELEDFLKESASKMARMKINENSGLGSLVYNVNIAKNELLNELLNHYSPDSDKFKKGFINLSEIVDQYLYHIIAQFSLLQNELIEEKNRLINSSHEDRLSLLGKMTSSFVHEFRNPLTTIHGFVQLLKAEHPELPYMDIILSELDQLKYRITQFLMLSKRQVTNQESEIFSLNDLLEQIASFIYPRLLELNVSLQRDLEDDLFVLGIQEEVRQVIINIIFNAIEVMADNPTDAVIRMKGYRQGDDVVLETSNTGPKIPDSLIKDIFKPFVTTKSTGTGLGLYVSHEIIEKHGGQLLCESDDEWTTFTIILKFPDEHLIQAHLDKESS